MRIDHLFYYGLVICLFAGSLTAQSPSRQSKRGQSDSSAVRLDETWEPLATDSLIDDFIDDMDVGLTPDELDELLKGGEHSSEKEQEVAPGFRVQIIATRDEETARQARADALLSLPDKVYLLYDNPYYKIRLGDCLSHAEADSLQQQAIRNGFVGAWIVRTIVNVKSSQARSAAPSPSDSTAIY